MKISDIKPKANSKRSKTRVGRGNGSGKGTYSTYGCKGAKARSGGTKGRGFEGGQTPIYKRIPKFKGFKTIEEVSYIIVNLEQLPDIAGDSSEINLNEKFKGRVKVLGRGEISKPLKVVASSFSASARDKILKANGSVEVI